MSWSEPLPAVWPPTHGDPRVQESGRAHRPCSEPQSGPRAGRGRHRWTGMSAGHPAACWGPGLRGTWEVCRVPWGMGGRGPGASEAVGRGPGDSALDREGSLCLGGKWGLVWGEGRDTLFLGMTSEEGTVPFSPCRAAWRWSSGCGRAAWASAWGCEGIPRATVAEAKQEHRWGQNLPPEGERPRAAQGGARPHGAGGGSWGAANTRAARTQTQGSSHKTNVKRNQR